MSMKFLVLFLFVYILRTSDGQSEPSPGVISKFPEKLPQVNIQKNQTVGDVGATKQEVKEVMVTKIADIKYDNNKETQMEDKNTKGTDSVKSSVTSVISNKENTDLKVANGNSTSVQPAADSKKTEEDLKKNEKDSRKPEEDLKISGNDTRKTEDDLKIKGKDTKKTEDDLKISGNYTRKTEEDLKKNEKDSKKPEEDLKIRGNDTRNTEDDLKINGKDTKKTEDDLKISGNDTRKAEENLKKNEKVSKKPEEDLTKNEKDAQKTTKKKADDNKEEKQSELITGGTTTTKKVDIKNESMIEPTQGLTTATSTSSQKIVKEQMKKEKNKKISHKKKKNKKGGNTKDDSQSRLTTLASTTITAEQNKEELKQGMTDNVPDLSETDKTDLNDQERQKTFEISLDKKPKTFKQKESPSRSDTGGSSHFVIFIFFALIFTILSYVIFQKRKKILGYLIEGKKSTRTARGTGTVRSQVPYTALYAEDKEALIGDLKYVY